LPSGPDGNAIRFIPPLDVVIGDLVFDFETLGHVLEAFKARA